MKTLINEDTMYFASIQDFMTTIIKINVLAFGGSFAAAFIGFVTGYVYHDAYIVTTLVCIFGLDLVTGIYASYIKKADTEGKDEGLKTFILAIQSRKLLRSFISMTFHLALLSMAWHISKSQSIFDWLPGLLVGGILGTQFVSVIENLNKAKVLNSSVVDLVVNRLDIVKLLKQKKESGDKPQ